MLPIHAGPIQAFYDKGFLRYIKAEGSEIVRMIYFALRDENWETLPIRIEKEKIQSESESFAIQYEAVNFSSHGDIFQWNCNIKGEKSGEITFEISGEALVDVKKNRAGFCILHPIKESINQPVEIHHPDNTRTNSIFPEYIAPEDPFKLIKSMRWKVKDKGYSLGFEGDLFETEDQRNWTDASFKTFCTPLEKPFPVLLKKGERVHQKVVFKPMSSIVKVTSRDKIEISISKNKIPFPALGIHDIPAFANERIINNMRKLKLSHLRIDVTLSDQNWQTDLSKALDRAVSFNLPVELAINVSANHKEELESLVKFCIEKRYPVKQINLYSTTHLTTAQDLIDFAVKSKSQIPTVKLGAGTDFNYTELNRNRFNLSALDFVTYAADPQEHASDDQTLIENVATLYHTVVSAKKIYPAASVHVSPVALKRRFNPYATDINNKVCSEKQRKDGRQTTIFCALWTLGSVKYLAEAGVSSITYFQTFGPLGLMSTDGEPYPVYESFQRLSGIASILTCTSSEPLKVDALFDASGRLILWNYTNEKQSVYIYDPSKEITLSPHEVKTFPLIN